MFYFLYLKLTHNLLHNLWLLCFTRREEGFIPSLPHLTTALRSACCLTRPIPTCRWEKHQPPPPLLSTHLELTFSNMTFTLCPERLGFPLVVWNGETITSTFRSEGFKQPVPMRDHEVDRKMRTWDMPLAMPSPSWLHNLQLQEDIEFRYYQTTKEPQETPFCYFALLHFETRQLLQHQIDLTQ